MKLESAARPNVREYVSSLAARGRYLFSSRDVQGALGVSADAAKLALHRLAKRGTVASPARGFYVIVPPEYRKLGCLPADQFIPALMEKLGLSYYAGLLSAAQYHGAAHYRPQQFQVFLAKARRPIKCGAVEVAFMVKRRLDEVPVQKFNTPRGTITVSTPEATALDLVGYQHHAGGLSQVATVLAELAEKIDGKKLAAAAATAPVPWAQRLGYLLALVGADEKTDALEAYVRKTARQSVALAPGASHEGVERDHKWKLYPNAEIEAELLP
jgi:predicted transcriptional regulator of viral defense system